MVNSRFCQRVLFLTALVCWLTAGCGDEPLSSPVSISSVEGNGSTPDKIAKPGTIIVTGSGFQVGDEIQVRNPSNGTVNTSGVLGSRYVSDTRLELDIDPDTFEAGKRTLVVARSGVPVAKASVTFLTGPEGPPGPPGSYIAGEGLEIIPSMIGDATINLKLATDGGLSKTLGAANDELGLAPGGVRAEHLSSMGATTTGQVLKWNNATGQWEPGIDDGSTYVAGTGIEIVGMGDTFTISAKIGTASDEVAAGNHNHSGVYAPISHQHSGADITSGTVADARLSSNVMLLNAPQVVTASKTFTAPIYLNDAAGVDATYRENGIDRNSGSDVTFEITNSGAGGMTLYVEGGKVWTSTNDGSGSTLDADLLDGRHESEFALLGGRAGGQTIYGGTGSGENLTLNSTSNATKGTVYVNSSGGNVVLASSTGGMVGVRTSSPQEELDVSGNLRTSSTVAIASTGTAASYNRIGDGTTSRSLNSSTDLLVSGKLEVDGTVYADQQLVVADRAAIGTSPTATDILHVYRPSTSYGAGQASICGYRTGSSTAANGGTGWGFASSDVGVKGFSSYGNNYTAGVAGYNYLDYNESAGVIGSNWNATTRGMLAYKDGSGNLWAGYFTGGRVYTEQPLVSGVSTGTAPFIVNSTTKVTNLNADLLDGYDSNLFRTGIKVVTYSGGNSSQTGNGNWQKLYELPNTFTKDYADTTVELYWSEVVYVSTGSSSYNYIQFQLRVDDTAGTDGIAHVYQGASTNTHHSIFAHGIFSGLSTGTHTISIYVNANTNTTYYINPGGYTKRVLVKEVLYRP